MVSRALDSRRRLAVTLGRALLRLTADVEVRGRERLPVGSQILVGNHLGHLDPLLAVTILASPPEIVALSDLWRAPVAPLLYLYRPLRVHRDEVDRALLTTMLAILGRGGSLLIFPEARISLSGALERARTGIGYLALRSERPVVPLAITGSERYLDSLRAARRTRLTITVGEPFQPRPDPSLPPRLQREAATTEVMTRIATLLPARYRGVYADGTDGVGVPRDL